MQVAMNFFPGVIAHGGKMNARVLEHSDSMARRLRLMDVPFIGGASGSTLCFILALEDMSVRGRATDALWGDDEVVYEYDGEGLPEGLIASIEEREALIGLFISVLIAGGAHSLCECLIVAQSMGYFRDRITRLDDAAPTTKKSFVSLITSESAVSIRQIYLRAKREFKDVIALRLSSLAVSRPDALPQRISVEAGPGWWPGQSLVEAGPGWWPGEGGSRSTEGSISLEDPFGLRSQQSRPAQQRVVFSL